MLRTPSLFDPGFMSSGSSTLGKRTERGVRGTANR